MNHKWNYQPPSQEQTEAAKALAKETGISPILCKLLLERGITSAAEAKRFFRPQLNELHDPFLMKDMSIAVEPVSYTHLDVYKRQQLYCQEKGS